MTGRRDLRSYVYEGSRDYVTSLRYKLEPHGHIPDIYGEKSLVIFVVPNLVFSFLVFIFWGEGGGNPLSSDDTVWSRGGGIVM